MESRGHAHGRTGGRGRSRRALAAGVLALLSLVLVASAGVPAIAQEDPPTTTEPPPDTTLPPETTLPPDTTLPPETTIPTDPLPETTVPTDPTTTEPSTTTTTEPGAPPKLDPGEALQPRPEFGSLSGYQLGLVAKLQRATDDYALRRFAQVELAHQLVAAKEVLDQTRLVESFAVTREVVSLAETSATHDDPPRAAKKGRARAAFVDEQLDDIRALRRDLASDRKDAKKARVRAQAVVYDLSAQLAARMQAVEESNSERLSAESAIENSLGPSAVRGRPDGITSTLLAEQSGQGDPIALGGLKPPMPGAALASPFGLRNDPFGGGAGFHPGMDISGSSGSAIQASADGVVVMAGDCGGYGNCVVIDHGNSIATLYGHQSQVLVSVGQRVDQDEVIGLVGSTGLSTGPHLHFEVRLRGVVIDPLLALSPA